MRKRLFQQSFSLGRWKLESLALVNIFSEKRYILKDVVDSTTITFPIVSVLKNEGGF